MNEIQELKRQLEEHDHKYYVLDNPEIDDLEYDALKRRYIALTGEEYTYVPGEALGAFDKVTHTYPIQSLAKVNTLEEAEEEMKRLAPFVIQPKLDGLTLVAYNANKMATRGNGTVGENVAHTASTVENIQEVAAKISSIPSIDSVRCEVFMSKPDFEKVNAEKIANGEDPFKNPRNAAAGMIRNKDVTRVQGLTYMAYNIVGSDLSEVEQLNILDNLGFITVPYAVYTAEEIPQAIEFIKTFDRTALPYEIDGLVIKSNRPNSLKEFGSTGHHPKNAVAYKFPAEGKWTRLNSITWQVGRTGKITPVAEIEPVDIGGSTISRVTLHNIGIIRALGIRIGEDVFVIKANDVIPAITECRVSGNVSFPVEEPTVCPECGGPVSKEIDQHFCTTPDCKAKNVNNLVHLAKRDALDIEGLSIETAEKMFKQGMIKNPFEIFELTVSNLEKIEGYGKKSAQKLYDNIQAARTPELKKFLYAAGLPLVGRTASEDIAKTFGSWEAMWASGEDGTFYDRLGAIEGIGEGSIDAVKEYGYLWAELAKYVTPKATAIKVAKAKDEIKTIVVTGTFEIGRSEIEQMIKDAGHKASGSVSKKTDYVLVGEAAGSKADKAAELGVKILRSITELKEVL